MDGVARLFVVSFKRQGLAYRYPKKITDLIVKSHCKASLVRLSMPSLKSTLWWPRLKVAMAAAAAAAGDAIEEEVEAEVEVDMVVDRLIINNSTMAMEDNSLAGVLLVLMVNLALIHTTSRTDMEHLMVEDPLTGIHTANTHNNNNNKPPLRSNSNNHPLNKPSRLPSLALLHLETRRRPPLLALLLILHRVTIKWPNTWPVLNSITCITANTHLTTTPTTSNSGNSTINSCSSTSNELDSRVLLLPLTETQNHIKHKDMALQDMDKDPHDKEEEDRLRMALPVAMHLHSKKKPPLPQISLLAYEHSLTDC